MLSARLAEEAARVYEMYGVDADPRWFPVLYTLGRGERRTVTELARIVGQSHAAVSQVVKAMSAAGLVDAVECPDDGRARKLGLTAEGRARVARMQHQLRDVTDAAQTMLAQSEHDLWSAIADAEHALSKQSFFDRVVESRRRRLARTVTIRDFVDADADTFAALNFAWIERYFRVEAKDRESLERPRTSILDRGGAILMAASGDEILGTVALVPVDGETVELAKMAVADHAQGLGIGRRLVESVLERARVMGAKRVYLESNTKLKPAIALYARHGFREVKGPASPYARANIQMERWLG